MSSMRTGADYRESLRDGRRVFVLGEGQVEDVPTHAATQAMVEEYVAWHDRHFDPKWQDTLLTPPDKNGKRSPVSDVLHLRYQGSFFSLYDIDRGSCHAK